MSQRSALEKQRRLNCYLSWWPHRLHRQCRQTRKSEYEGGREIGRNIADAGVTVAYCTTDGDLRLHKGVAQSILEANPSHQVKRLADLVHLSQTQDKRAKKKNFQTPPLSRHENKERDRSVNVFWQQILRTGVR